MGKLWLLGLIGILLLFALTPGLAQMCDENQQVTDEHGRIRIVHGPLQKQLVGNRQEFFVGALGWIPSYEVIFDKLLKDQPDNDVWLLVGLNDPRARPRPKKEAFLSGKLSILPQWERGELKADEIYELFPNGGFSGVLLSMDPCITTFLEEQRRHRNFITITFRPEFVESK